MKFKNFVIMPYCLRTIDNFFSYFHGAAILMSNSVHYYIVKLKWLTRVLYSTFFITERKVFIVQLHIHIKLLILIDIDKIWKKMEFVLSSAFHKLLIYIYNFIVWENSFLIYFMKKGSFLRHVAVSTHFISIKLFTSLV